ncbi:hypothetical protein KUV51_08245 [Tateyamaria omphalii]|uniref:hypothetical protein n=1 Tax=Tateyamaria omphalii TaxID=299262 RepID=UPI001C99A9D9|nr:hypothetical protein [Tateyamaria omphalii]MBY5932984.1 hypothetical protein [Tateyamaria omphalii]
MTATFDATTDTSRSDAPRAGVNMDAVAHFVTRAAGVTLTLAGIWVWLEPTAHAGADLVAMKLAVSLVLCLAGFMILQEDRANDTFEVEIDLVRREVRTLTGRGRHRKVAGRAPICDLSKAELRDNAVQLKSADDDVLAEVSLTDPDVRRSMLGALRDAGKL